MDDNKTQNAVKAKPEAKDYELAILWVEARVKRIINTFAGGLITMCVVVLQPFLAAGRLIST